MQENVTDWTAVYLSARSDGTNPTKSGFRSKAAAERYSHKYFCKGCRDKVAKALYWRRKYNIVPYEAAKRVYNVLSEMIKDLPKEKEIELEMEMDDIFGDESGDSCGCEWLFIPTDKYEGCEDFGDLMRAVGAKEITNDVL